MGALIQIDKFRKVIGHPAVCDTERFKNTLHTVNLRHRYERCCVCKWNKGDVKFTLVRDKRSGGYYSFDNVLPLCPNHDIEFKSCLMSGHDMYYVQEFLWTICNEIAPFKS